MTSVVDTLSKKQKNAIAVEAMKAAKALGYCAEARNVLDEMGFELGSETKKVRLEFDLEIPVGLELDDDMQIYLSIEDTETGDYLIDTYYSGNDLTVVS